MERKRTKTHLKYHKYNFQIQYKKTLAAAAASIRDKKTDRREKRSRKMRIQISTIRRIAYHREKKHNGERSLQGEKGEGGKTRA